MKAGKQGIIICGHGSRNRESADLFKRMAERFASTFPQFAVTHAFLELQPPDFRTAVDKLVMQGISDIIVLPAFLFTGVHVSHDIPFAFRQLARQNRGISIRMAGYIGINEHLKEIIHQRISERMLQAQLPVSEKIALMFVGVGASIEKANRDFAILADGVGSDLHAVRYSYSFISGMADPEFENALEQMCRETRDTIIVVPVLLFPGIYTQRIASLVHNASVRNNRTILLTETFGNHSGFASVLFERYSEVIDRQVDLIAELPDEAVERRSFEN